MMRKGLTIVLLSTLATLATAGCGDDGGRTATAVGYGTSKPRGDLVVSAASSLKTAFTTYGDAFDGARVRFSFAPLSINVKTLDCVGR